MYADAIIVGTENLKLYRLREDFMCIPRRNPWSFICGLFTFTFRELNPGHRFTSHMSQLSKEHSFAVNTFNLGLPLKMSDFIHRSWKRQLDHSQYHRGWQENPKVLFYRYYQDTHYCFHHELWTIMPVGSGSNNEHQSTLWPSGYNSLHITEHQDQILATN